MNLHHTSTCRSKPKAGFTLVEILVVIVIIIILVGLGLGVGAAVLNKGEESKTKITLKNAHALLDEYQTLTGRSASDLFSELPGSDTTGGVNLLFTKAASIKRLEELFAAFDSDALVKDGSTWKLYDGWDNEIHLKYADSKNPSGAVLPNDGQPYFASRGSDNKWGRYNGTDTQKKEEADNLYSHRSN